NALIYHATLSDLTAQAPVNTWLAGLVTYLHENDQHGSSYNGVVRENRELHLFEPVLRVRTHGVDTDYPLDNEFSLGGEYRKICALGEQLRGLIDEDAYIDRG
ncbi:DNA gyrase subunit B, partial [Erwinia amylovora]|nr:DNA gyrase subunit B [Erwinia amylovora]